MANEKQSPVLSVRRALVWSFGARYFAFALQFLFSIAIARLLDPAETGLFSVAAAFVYILQNVQGLALSQYLVRERDIDDTTLRSAFGLVMATSFASSGLLAACSWMIADFYKQPEIRNIVLLLAAANLLTPFGAPAYALLMRDMRYNSIFRIDTLALAGAVAVGIGTAAAGEGAMSQAWYALALGFIKSILLLALFPEHIRMLPSAARWRDMLRFGSMMTAINTVLSLGARLPELVMPRTFGMADIGHFGRGASVTEQAQALLAKGGASAIFSAFARMRNEGRPLGPPYVKLSSYITVIVWPAFIALALLAEPVVHLLFGPRWHPVAPVIQWLCLAQIINNCSTSFYDIAVTARRTRTLLSIYIADLVLGGGIFVLFAMTGDLATAAAGRVGTAVVHAVLVLWCLRGMIGLSIREQMAAFAHSGLVAALSVAPVLAVRMHWSADPYAMPIAAWVGACIATIILWAILLFLFRHPVRDEVRMAMRSLAARRGRTMQS